MICWQTFLPIRLHARKLKRNIKTDRWSHNLNYKLVNYSNTSLALTLSELQKYASGSTPYTIVISSNIRASSLTKVNVGKNKTFIGSYRRHTLTNIHFRNISSSGNNSQFLDLNSYSTTSYPTSIGSLSWRPYSNYGYATRNAQDARTWAISNCGSKNSALNYAID